MDMFYVHSSNIVRTVAALEKQGLIMRSPNDKDKRTCKLYPTERALSVIDEVQTVCEKTEMCIRDRSIAYLYSTDKKNHTKKYRISH